MAQRLAVMALVALLVVASVMAFVAAAPRTPAAAQAPSAGHVRAAATTPVFYYNYSDFFDVPYGEWWDIRTNFGYGDEPVGASCFNGTSVADGTCTTNVAGLPRVASYPYMDWAGSGNAANQGSATNVYAPYRADINGLYVPGYNLSQPVFLPVTNYGTAPGNLLSFRWNMQYMDVAEFNLLTSTLGCYNGAGANANDGYQLVNRIYLTLDNQEAARLFGSPATGTPQQIQTWWSNNVKPGCAMTTGGKNPQAGPLETAVNTWFSDEANGKYTIYNGYAAAYTSLYTNITATVVSGGATGTTNVYIEHGAWGTEILLDRWWYWGNATYAGNQLDSSKARGWWGMENGWWEDVNYAGILGAATMNFNLTGVLQYHFQEHSAPGPDGVYRSASNPNDADDTPYWTWGPMLVDYVFSSNKGPYSELDRFSGVNYIKTTPGSGDYGTNTSFDYTPVSWAAPANEWWNFAFPTNASAYYQNPATAPLGTDPLLAGQLPTITSTLSLQKIFPAGYGTWNAGTGTWNVTGGTTENWPPSTGPGTYPYIPYPGIYLQPSGIPPALTTDPASAITATTATLNAHLDSLGTAASVSVGFLWGTDSGLAGAANVTVGSLTGTAAFSTGLTGLTPGTTYYFEAWGSGDGFAHGSILSFTAGLYPPSVSTVAASKVGITSATLNGDLTDLGSATSVKVGFLWGTDPALAGATNVTVGTMSARGPFAHNLSGLAQATTYYFEAWANGSAFAAGSILGFTTGAPPVVLTVPATGITATGATLNGNLTDLGSVATVTVGFLWGTSATLAGASNVTVGPMTMVGPFNNALTGLLPATTYYFEAWALGASFATGSILGFTTSTVPPTVATDAATSVSPTAATLNGHTTSLGTAASVAVGFLWGTDSGLLGATNVTAGTQTTAGPFTHGVTVLTPGTTYYFAAWANGDGFVEGSILSFTATVTPPSVTTNAATSITPATATLNGDLTDLGSATSVSVGFLWGTDAALAGAANVTVGPLTAVGTFSHNLVGLTPGTTYYFEAWANGDGFAHGTITSFTSGVTPPSVSTNAATGITTVAATLNGDLTSLGTAASAEVGFLWGTSSTLAGATNVSGGGQTAPGVFSHALSALTPATTYYFRAWANGAGFANGSILSFATETPPAPPSASTVTANGITTSAATLNGNLAGLGTASTVSVGFLWGTSSSLASAANASAGSLTATGAFTYGLTGLTPATTYYFRAWALGDGFVAGSILSFATNAVIAPPSVTSMEATGISTNGATLNANLGSLGSASGVTIGFLWGTDANLVGATNVTVGPETGTGAFTTILSGLTPGTKYYFEAWVLGDGFAHGSILTFTTKSAVPPSAEPTFLGMPAVIGYAVLAAIIIVVIVVVLVVLLMMRKRKQAPPPENP